MTPINCVICQSADQRKAGYVLSCGAPDAPHAFHRVCLVSSGAESCPLCRRDMTESEKQEIRSLAERKAEVTFRPGGYNTRRRERLDALGVEIDRKRAGFEERLNMKLLELPERPAFLSRLEGRLKAGEQFDLDALDVSLKRSVQLKEEDGCRWVMRNHP